MKYSFHVIATLILLAFSSCQNEKPDKPVPYTQIGEASYYARMLEGNPTASGEIYRQDSLTAAHPFLPLGTIARVVNLDNKKEVTVKINDRGPYAKNRIIDLSRAAAKKLDMMESGVADVKIIVVEPAPGYSVNDSVVHDQRESL